MESAAVRDRLERALVSFRDSERYLLEHDLREETISARLAMHLQLRFENYSVDVEYSRMGNLAKRLNIPENCARKRDKDGTALVFPDIIVHQRGPDGPNLLVVEIKKTSNALGFDCDRIRITAFRNELRYLYGALIECETRKTHEKDISLKEWIE